jgi:hypothetical protein
MAAVLVAAVGTRAGQPRDAGPGRHWYKGNTHTHTLNSDGDSTPDDVARWYREHGYHFLVLTDHNYLTSVDGLQALHGAGGRFLIIQGEEVTDRFGDAPVHVNGLGVQRLVPPQGGATLVQMLQRSVDAVRAASGTPHINHPNFGWALDAETLAQVGANRLIEIFNGHPQVNNLGGGGSPGVEEMWDLLLTRGLTLYGIAVDDAHVFKQPGNPDVAGPGRGWVVVRSASLSTAALLDALEAGDFYASTGVELRDVRVEGAELVVEVATTRWSRYRVQFVGPGGRVLDEATTSPARRRIPDGAYLRARIVESNGRMAWTQPVRMR